MSLSMSMNETKKAKGAVNHTTGEPVADIVHELTEHLGDQLLKSGREPRQFANYGVPLSDDELRQKLWSYKGRLDNLVQQHPHNEGESLDDYVSRLSRVEPRVESMLGIIADIDAHFAIEARKRRDEAKAVAEHKRQEERRQRRETERRASPDPKEIKELQAIIHDAREGERFLDDIIKALAKHHAAGMARERLKRIYDDERSACAQIGKRAPSREPVSDAPAGANEFSRIVRSADAWRRPG